MRVIGRATTRYWGVVLLACLVRLAGASGALRAQVGIPRPDAPPRTPPSGVPPPAAAPTPPPAPFELAWTAPVDASDRASLTFATGALIAGGPNTPLRAFALDDGRLLWTSTTDADMPVAVSDDIVAVVVGGRLVVLSTTTGARRWDVAINGDAPSPLVAGTTVAVAAGTSMLAYRADGTPLWQQGLGAAAAAAPVAAGGRLFVALAGKGLTAIDLLTGRLLWRVDTGQQLTSLAAGDGRLYAGTDAAACAFNQNNGQPAWSGSLGSPCFRLGVGTIGPAAIDERSSYFAFTDNTVRVFDRGNGALRRRDTTPARPAAGPALAGANLVVPLLNSEFLVLNRKTGDASHVTQPNRPAGEAPEPPDGPAAESLEAAAVSNDGRLLAMLTVAPGGARTLTVFRPVAPPAQKSGQTPAVAPLQMPTK